MVPSVFSDLTKLLIVVVVDSRRCGAQLGEGLSERAFRIKSVDEPHLQRSRLSERAFRIKSVDEPHLQPDFGPDEAPTLTQLAVCTLKLPSSLSDHLSSVDEQSVKSTLSRSDEAPLTKGLLCCRRARLSVKE